MPAPNLIITDDLGATITQGTAQVITGQIPGTPTAGVEYGVKNDGATNDTAFNVKAQVSGRLVAAGGDYLSQGVTYVDEGALEVRLLDAFAGNPTTGWQPVGFQKTITLGDIEADATQVFETRINGETDTAQVELLITVLRDLRASPVGDDIGTGSGVHLGSGDGETTDTLSRSGSATAVGTPSHIVELDDQAWLYRGEPYQILAADLHTTAEDGSDVALSPADATKGYYIGLTLGHVVVMADTWTVGAASPNVTAANTLGDATTSLTVGDYVQLGAEIHEVATITDDDNIILHTNHAAGSTAQPMFEGWHVAKGDQVLLSARTDADKPTLPAGEVYSTDHPSGEIFIWREGDDTIEQGDIDDQGTVGFYTRSASGLDITIGRGRSKVRGYEADTSTSDTITLPANQTNLIQINGPDDAAIQSTTDGSLNPGAMALYEDVTDGSSVTASVDRRKFLGEERVSISGTDNSSGKGATGTFGLAINPFNCPMYVRPDSIIFEMGPADPSSLGYTGGAWLVDIFRFSVAAGIGASIFRTQGTDDRRPTIAFDDTVSLAEGLHERVRVPGGAGLVVDLVQIPTGPGTIPNIYAVSWAWMQAR